MHQKREFIIQSNINNLFMIRNSAQGNQNIVKHKDLNSNKKQNNRQKKIGKILTKMLSAFSAQCTEQLDYIFILYSFTEK